MKKLTAEFVKENTDFITSEMKSGKIFIYPTDTVYGIGCSATTGEAAAKIHDIKKRDGKPFLVIVPSLSWIKEYSQVNESFFPEIEQKLPGPYSFIVTLNEKGKEIISKEVTQGKDTVGIRIPDSFFSNIVKKANIPFVSTSVNFSGKPPATKVLEISKEIIEQVDYVIESDTELSGTPSSIYDLTGSEIKKLR